MSLRFRVGSLFFNETLLAFKSCYKKMIKHYNKQIITHIPRGKSSAIQNVHLFAEVCCHNDYISE